MYVLIVMTWLGGYITGTNVTMQEFSSLEACHTAQKELSDRFAEWSMTKNAKAFCVPK